jgi:hypothetical protein
MTMQLLFNDGCTLMVLERQKRTAMPGFHLYFMNFESQNKFFRKPKTRAKCLIFLREKSLFEPVDFTAMPSLCIVVFLYDSLHFVLRVISIYLTIHCQIFSLFLVMRSAILSNEDIVAFHYSSL